MSRLSGFTARMPSSTGDSRLTSHRKNQNEVLTKTGRRKP